MLPDIFPGVLSGFLLAFTLSLDDFIITHFTRGNSVSTLSTLIYSETERFCTQVERRLIGAAVRLLQLRKNA